MTTGHSLETFEFLTTRDYALSSYALTYVALKTSCCSRPPFLGTPLAPSRLRGETCENNVSDSVDSENGVKERVPCTSIHLHDMYIPYMQIYTYVNT